MALSRKRIEAEIAGAEQAIKSCRTSIGVNTIVLNAFVKELAKLPEKKENTAIIEGSTSQ